MNDSIYTQQAVHVMWLQRRLAVHRRWQRWLMLAWIGSIAAVVFLFVIALPFLQTRLFLPSEVFWVTAVGVGIELLTLLYLTRHVFLRKRSLEAELDRLLQ